MDALTRMEVEYERSTSELPCCCELYHWERDGMLVPHYSKSMRRLHSTKAPTGRLETDTLGERRGRDGGLKWMMPPECCLADKHCLLAFSFQFGVKKFPNIK